MKYYDLMMTTQSYSLVMESNNNSSVSNGNNLVHVENIDVDFGGAKDIPC